MPAVVPAHVGGLHPFETVLLLLVAFGPFVVLAGVLVRQRRRERHGRPADHGDH